MSTQDIVIATYHFKKIGGKERDCIALVEHLAKHRWQVTVATARPDFFLSYVRVVEIPVRGVTNCQKMQSFSMGVGELKQQYPGVPFLGFNKVGGLDFYFAADVCWLHRWKDSLKRFLPRYHAYLQLEGRLFSPDSQVQVAYLTDLQRCEYEKYYGSTKKGIVLPPAIPELKLDRDASRRHLIKNNPLFADSCLLLFVAAAPETKGIDRVIMALYFLLQSGKRCQLLVLGGELPKAAGKLVENYCLQQYVHCLGMVDYPTDYMQAADVLVHPAYTEAGGSVLIEAMASGLAIVCSKNCGFSSFVNDANAGLVLSEPFDQNELNNQLLAMVDGRERREDHGKNGVAFLKQKFSESRVEAIEKWVKNNITK